VTLRFAIRPFAATDRDQVREINRLALRMVQPGTFEKLLASGDDALARVAVGEDGRVLGHVIFAPALISLPGREVHGMGLGELAVLPRLQRQGIGTRLGQAALAELRTTDCAFVIVVGHASYYPRFGFRPGASFGLRCQWQKVPDESFMALVLDEAAMRGVTGVARFRDIA
jgi:putative acetyltransferase